MKIDLHPDDLLDRDAAGTLDDASRARLDAHLAVCVACRFEREARRDFACEAADDADRLSAPIAGALLALKSAPPKALPPVVEAPRVASVRVAAPRRGLRVGLLVAAAMMVVGVAAATTGAVRWMSQPSQPVEPAAVEPAPAVAPVRVTPPRARVVVPSAPASADAPVEAVAPEPVVVVQQPVAPLDVQLPVVAPAVAPVTRHAPHVVAPPVVPASVAVAPSVVEPAVVEPAVVAPVPVAPAVRAASAIFADANEARRRGDTARAIELYRELDKLHPNSAEARVGRAAMGRMLLESGDARAALERFDAYLAPGAGTLSEEAILGRAESLARLGKASEERAAWQQLLRTYPSSPHAPRAKARLSVLGGS